MMRPLARAWLRKTQPNRNDHEDLEGAVIVALLEAERRFTGTRDSWPAYAWPRIKGAIIDEIRRERPYGFRKYSSSDESVPTVLSLNLPVEGVDDADRELGDSVSDPESFIDRDPISEQRLRDAIAALAVDQRMVVEMLIEEDWVLEELAQALNTSSSALCQVRMTIRKQLLESLEHPMSRAEALRLLRSESHLRSRVKTGYSVREIAAELGVHRTSVREKMRMYGIKPIERPSLRPNTT